MMGGSFPSAPFSGSAGSSSAAGGAPMGFPPQRPPDASKLMANPAMMESALRMMKGMDPESVVGMMQASGMPR